MGKIMLTSGFMDSKKLSHSTAIELKESHSISFGNECGYCFAYGRDKYGELTVVVHANSREEFDLALESSEERENRLETVIAKLDDKNLPKEERKEIIRSLARQNVYF